MKHSKMYKILLIQPTQYSSSGSRILCKQKRIYLPGLVFPLLSSLTPSNWKLETCIEVIEDVDFETDADLIGIGAMGHSTFRGLHIAKKFKEKGKIVFFGGYMASINPDYVLQWSDSVIIGDAEKSYPELLKDFEEHGRLKRIYKNPLENLDGLPSPDYTVLSRKKIGFMLPVQAGRGCPHSCSFCSIACLYKGSHLRRPLPEVIEDVLKIKKLGYKMFYLIDDNLVGNPEYLKELCERLIPLKMKWASQSTLLIAKQPDLLKLAYKSGCRILSLGLETIDQSGLDQFNKTWIHACDHLSALQTIQKAGIMPSVEMILGHDNETAESVKRTYEFVVKAKIPIPRFYVLTPVPGTDLYDRYKKEGRLIHEDFEKFTVTQSVFYPKNMAPQELDKWYSWINKKIFSIPIILYRTIWSTGFLRNPLVHLFALAVNLQYRGYIRRGDVPNIL